MTALRSDVARRFGRFTAAAPGAPPAEFTFAPTTAEDAAAVLDFASEHGLRVLPWGGGSDLVGPAGTPDIVLSTAGLIGFDWRPEDLTVVAAAGVRVADLESRLAERGQTAVLPEHPGVSTVGGVVAAGSSGWRRLRYGPMRDRVLEVVVATGDGRVIRGGGQVVKNSSGYDIPRLCVGSHGSLGVITRVCLKLWPVGAATATVTVDDAATALAMAHRPLAVLQTPAGASVYLAGTVEEVDDQVRALGGDAVAGLVWPVVPTGAVQVVVRVPPTAVATAVARIGAGDGYHFVAAQGVGEVRVAGAIPVDEVLDWRGWAHTLGGSLVITSAPDGFAADPWGPPPATVVLQRRVKAAFDPVGVLPPVPGDH